MDEQSCRCCGNPEAYLFDDGRYYCDLCVSNVVADAAYQAQLRDVDLGEASGRTDEYVDCEDVDFKDTDIEDYSWAHMDVDEADLDADPWEPAPSCTECRALLQVVEDTRPWNRGAYSEWCPLCGYRDAEAEG